MSMITCNCNCKCTAAALIASAVIGVLTAFLLITGVITVTTVFLWVALGIAVVYLGILAMRPSCGCAADRNGCCCTALNTLLAGILGTILLALVLLSVGIVATSVISAILVGLLLFFLALTLTGAACYVRAVTGCES